MTCIRCQGLMVQDQLFDFEGAYGHLWATSSRCLNCGHVHDPVIEANHRSRPVKAVLVSIGTPDYLDNEVHLGAESFLRQAA
ncbi:MAG: hypothetical protein HP491_13590 [Nitrospira sp.]|nr:hypothetical protein [Nitrospira sp.]MBH0181184.1 hypothetical protein [Nitrospira sp.]MBH0184903.1 hypothetical protein [Nitrospira sp.]